MERQIQSADIWTQVVKRVTKATSSTFIPSSSSSSPSTETSYRRKGAIETLNDQTRHRNTSTRLLAQSFWSHTVWTTSSWLSYYLRELCSTPVLFIEEYLLYIWRPLGKGNGCAPIRGFLFLIKADLKGPDRCGVCWRRVQRERNKPQSQCAQTPRACRQRQGLTQRHSVAGKLYLRVETSRQIPGSLKP